MITAEKLQLLESIDPDSFEDFPALRQKNGREASPSEVELLGSLTLSDLAQYCALLDSRVDQAQASGKVAHRLEQLVRPYCAQHPGVVLADLLPLIPEPDRSEIRQLVEILAPGSLQQ